MMTRFFLFTVDADWIPGSEPGLESLLHFADRYRLKMTVFVTGRFAQENMSLMREVLAEGHELGVHGWEHGLCWQENFRFAGYEEQKDRLVRATEVIGDILGESPKSFRAPFLWISETTFRVLNELGYQVDSSVPARRYDALWGMVDWWRYYFAPLEPYYPDPSHAGKKGINSIIEVPPSAFLLPLVMSTYKEDRIKVGFLDR